MVGVLFAAILYHTFLNKNDQDKKKKSSSSSLRRAVIGSVLPVASILTPYALFDAMGTKQSAVRFTICMPFYLYIFRILKAIFGFIPTGAKASFGVYCTYFSLLFDMIFDENTCKPVKCNKRDIWNDQIALVKAVTCTIMLCSMLSPYDYKPFGETNAGEFQEGINLRDYWDMRHLVNGLAIGCESEKTYLICSLINHF